MPLSGPAWARAAAASLAGSARRAAPPGSISTRYPAVCRARVARRRQEGQQVGLVGMDLPDIEGAGQVVQILHAGVVHASQHWLRWRRGGGSGPAGENGAAAEGGAASRIQKTTRKRTISASDLMHPPTALGGAAHLPVAGSQGK